MTLRRGELYLVPARRGDPRRQRVFIVVSRRAFLESRYSSAVCVPVYSGYGGLPTEVRLDPSAGLKHESAARCDEVTSIGRNELTNYIGALPPDRLSELDRALAVAVGIDHLIDDA